MGKVVNTLTLINFTKYFRRFHDHKIDLQLFSEFVCCLFVWSTLCFFKQENGNILMHNIT